MHKQSRSCSVFVGNIPYDADEEALKQIFARVGEVVSLRMMYDKDTHQSKGYGFVEYTDMNIAYSAMRNLNNVEYNGRPLRVDWADHELRNQEGMPWSSNAKDSNKPEWSQKSEKALNDKLAEMRSRLSGISTNDASPGDIMEDLQTHAEISAIMSSLPTMQLFQFIGQTYRLVTEQPDILRSYLIQNPKLILCLNQAMFLTGFMAEPALPLTPEDGIWARERINALKKLQLAPPIPPLVGTKNNIAGSGFDKHSVDDKNAPDISPIINEPTVTTAATAAAATAAAATAASMNIPHIQQSHGVFVQPNNMIPPPHFYPPPVHLGYYNGYSDMNAQPVSNPALEQERNQILQHLSTMSHEQILALDEDIKSQIRSAGIHI